MTEITERIRAWSAGRVSDADLVEYLAGRQYDRPARFDDQPSDPFALAEQEDADYHQAGTWDEVATACAAGLLSRDLYLRVCGVMDARLAREAAVVATASRPIVAAGGDVEEDVRPSGVIALLPDDPDTP